MIRGSLKTDKWEDKDGNKRSTLKVRVQEFDFVGKKGDSKPAATTEAKPEPDEPTPETTDVEQSF